MDKLSSETSTMTPDFVITEHSIKKNHKTYYEKREAKTYNMDQEDFRLDVKITRCIGDFCLIVFISQYGNDEIFIHEHTNLSENGLKEFKEDWNANWRPVLPRDDGLTPLMLAICNLDPYLHNHETVEKVDVQSADGKFSSTKKDHLKDDSSKNPVQAQRDQVKPKNPENAELKSGNEEKQPIPEKHIILQKLSTHKDQIGKSSKNNVEITMEQKRTVRTENVEDDRTGKELITEKNFNTSIEEPMPAIKVGISELDRIESLEERVATLEEQVRILTEMSKKLHEIILEH